MTEDNEATRDEEQTEQPSLAEEARAENNVEVQSAEFQELTDDAEGSNLSLDLIMDISMPVTVELGRATMTVQQLLQLGGGSVVELNKMAGEPADLYVRDVRLARGEIVVVENHFGLRITEILDGRHKILPLHREQPRQRAEPEAAAAGQ